MPKGFHDLAYNITSDGKLALLRAEVDVWARLSVQCHWDFRPAFANGVRAHLSLFDGQSETAATAFTLDAPFVVFDHAADGNWIVADRRCRGGEQNARVLSPQGNIIRRFHIGDAIEHLQCDNEDGLWVGYFDEGQSGYHGLIRFNQEGQVTWRSSGPSANLDVFDCYSLNVASDAAWSSYYTDFPIVRIDRQGNIKQWAGSIIGVRAIAVEETTVLLAGGYENDRDRLALLSLDGTDAALIGELRLDLPQEETVLPTLFQARADKLHIVRNQHWYQISVHDVRSRLES